MLITVNETQKYCLTNVFTLTSTEKWFFPMNEMAISMGHFLGVSLTLIHLYAKHSFVDHF